MPIQKYDGLPISAGEALIDALRFRLHLGHQVVIALDMRPARSADLHEHESLAIGRMQLEEPLDAAKSFRNSLGVIYAIDAEPEIFHFVHAKAAEQRRALFVRGHGRDWGRLLAVERHADRKRSHRREVI